MNSGCVNKLKSTDDNNLVCTCGALTSSRKGQIENPQQFKILSPPIGFLAGQFPAQIDEKFSLVGEQSVYLA